MALHVLIAIPVLFLALGACSRSACGRRRASRSTKSDALRWRVAAIDHHVDKAHGGAAHEVSGVAKGQVERRLLRGAAHSTALLLTDISLRLLERFEEPVLVPDLACYLDGLERWQLLAGDLFDGPGAARRTARISCLLSYSVRSCGRASFIFIRPRLTADSEQLPPASPTEATPGQPASRRWPGSFAGCSPPREARRRRRRGPPTRQPQHDTRHGR